MALDGREDCNGIVFPMRGYDGQSISISMALVALPASASAMAFAFFACDDCALFCMFFSAQPCLQASNLNMSNEPNVECRCM